MVFMPNYPDSYGEKQEEKEEEKKDDIDDDDGEKRFNLNLMTQDVKKQNSLYMDSKRGLSYFRKATVMKMQRQGLEKRYTYIYDQQEEEQVIDEE